MSASKVLGTARPDGADGTVTGFSMAPQGRQKAPVAEQSDGTASGGITIPSAATDGMSVSHPYAHTVADIQRGASGGIMWRVSSSHTIDTSSSSVPTGQYAFGAKKPARGSFAGGATNDGEIQVDVPLGIAAEGGPVATDVYAVTNALDNSLMFGFATGPTLAAGVAGGTIKVTYTTQSVKSSHAGAVDDTLTVDHVEYWIFKDTALVAVGNGELDSGAPSEVFDKPGFLLHAPDTTKFPGANAFLKMATTAATDHSGLTAASVQTSYTSTTDITGLGASQPVRVDALVFYSDNRVGSYQLGSTTAHA